MTMMKNFLGENLLMLIREKKHLKFVKNEIIK